LRFISIVLVAALFSGCALQNKPKVAFVSEANKEPKTNQQFILEDLEEVPQDIKYYTKNLPLKDISQMQDDYEKNYFAAWNMKKIKYTIEDAKWAFRVFESENVYGENLLLRDKNFFQDMLEQSNFEDYDKLSRKALTLQYSNLRAFPTHKPLFRDPSIAGEGFPFDYLQNSGVNANTPIYVSHYSKNKQWVFVCTNYTFGWLKKDEVVFLDEKYTTTWKDAKQVRVTQEGIPLYDSKGVGLFNTRLGTMFPVINEDDDNYTVLAVSSYKNNQAYFHHALIPKYAASEKYLQLNTNNINKIVSQLSKSKYGWGGLYKQRDCSSTLMDLFSPFGIYLPRNSSQQAKVGKVFDLKGMNDLEKEKFIKNNAIPFQTLLYRKGHIVLYVGVYNGEIIVFQNMWGIRTKHNEKEGRVIIGRSIFSSLHLGEKLKSYDHEADLLKNIESMNIVTE